jgi:glyoxylase-like metal-dependent hydrolase (beta-lactamase superfamily II)
MRFEVVPVRSLMENAYLIKGERIALVDTLAPFSWPVLQKKLTGENLSAGDIELILITHCHVDHVGNLARLRALSGATIIAGEADIPVIEGSAPAQPPSDLSMTGRMLGRMPRSILEWYQRFEPVAVDRAVSGGETIEELGLEVLALPGHTAGGVGFHDGTGGRAFTGDLVSNYRSSPGMPVLGTSISLEEIFASQELLAGLDLDVAYPGHGAVVRPGASKRIGEMLARQKARARKQT